jgi:hypothetical protein
LAALAEELRRSSAFPTAIVQFLDAWLEGSYPNTVTAIRYLDRRNGTEDVYREELWDMREATDAELPEELAIQIAIQFGENC